MPVPFPGKDRVSLVLPPPLSQCCSALRLEGPDRTPVSQFRQFQAVTLTRLQETGENYNLSHNLHTKVDQLLQKQESLQLVANGSWASTQEELHRLQTWVKKLERNGKKQALRIRALEEAWKEAQQKQQEQQESRLSNLTQELESHREDFRNMAVRQQSLQKTLQSLQDALHRQGSKLGSIKRRLKSFKQKEALPSPWTAARPFGPEKALQAAGGQSPTLKKLRAKHHQPGGRLEALANRGPLLGQAASPLQVDPSPDSSPEPQTSTEEPPGPAKVPAEEKPPGGPRKPGTSRYIEGGCADA